MKRKTVKKRCAIIRRWAKRYGIDLPDMSKDMTEITPFDFSFLSSRNRKLTSIPNAITQLKWLTSIDLSYCNLRTIPKSLFTLPDLRELYASNNQITVIPKSIGKAKKLEILNLENNRITTIPESIRRCESLRELYLGENPIEEVPEAVWESARLEVVEVGNKRFDVD